MTWDKIVSGDRERLNFGEIILGTLLRYALLPAAALAIAVIAQPLVTALVPAAERFDIGGLSADSYIPIVVSAVLCFGVGYWPGKRVRSRQIVVSLAIFPLLWLRYMVWTIHLLGARTFSEYAAAVYFEVDGIVPLMALFVGWTTAGLKRGRAG
jgi:hypothetical protein